MKFSKLTRQVYEQFTDKVEPYGMDECWLQVYNAKTLAAGGFEIAEDIRNAVKKEVGLTVSVGASFNKVFAKLGSDMKKPDATTVITQEDFRQKVWPLHVSELLYVGRSTAKRLAFHGIHTVGALAGTDPEFLRQLFGVNGLVLWRFANGEDNASVMHKDFVVPVKSVGHGITCRSDLESEDEVWLVMLELCQDISHRLIVNGLSATGIQIAIKDNSLATRQYQAPLQIATQSPLVIARRAQELFCEKHIWSNNLRAVTVRAIDLIPQSTPWQTDLFSDPVRIEKREALAAAVDGIRERFGRSIIYPASLALEQKIPSENFKLHVLPGQMLR
jgi:DNA polymerase-4